MVAYSRQGLLEVDLEEADSVDDKDRSLRAVARAAISHYGLKPPGEPTGTGACGLVTWAEARELEDFPLSEQLSPTPQVELVNGTPMDACEWGDTSLAGVTKNLNALPRHVSKVKGQPVKGIGRRAFVYDEFPCVAVADGDDFRVVLSLLRQGCKADDEQVVEMLRRAHARAERQSWSKPARRRTTGPCGRADLEALGKALGTTVSYARSALLHPDQRCRFTLADGRVLDVRVDENPEGIGSERIDLGEGVFAYVDGDSSTVSVARPSARVHVDVRWLREAERSRAPYWTEAEKHKVARVFADVVPRAPFSPKGAPAAGPAHKPLPESEER